MNRSADELIEAMKFCVLDGGASGFLIGDNEMARLVVEWREMKSAAAVSAAYEPNEARGKVTPEMIEAGLLHLYRYDPETGVDDAETVVRIFLSMQRLAYGAACLNRRP